MNILKKWFGYDNEKQVKTNSRNKFVEDFITKNTVSFEIIDTNIRRLSNDSDITKLLSLSTTLKKMYEELMLKPKETQMGACILDTQMAEDSHEPSASLIIAVRYGFSTEEGQ